ncbi:hypothetical protein [Jannaschia sp. R86511]|uniref:hypothetical protein n=1 Tax=Jannaschia sp. R86511 TaxID=3093853 RepID=UPI0036D386CD
MSRANPPRPTSTQEVWERPFVKTHDAWCGGFVLELRHRDVPGPVIGDRLAEVEAHCTETGEAPSEAFGDPTDYAAHLDHDSAPEHVQGVWTVTAVAAAQVLAMLVGTSAVPAWVRGEHLTYNLAQVACLGLVLFILLSLPLLLRPMLRRPWTVGVPSAAVLLLGAGGAALSGRADLPTVAQLPAPAVAVGLFVTVLVLAWIEYRALARDAEGDLVISPLATPTGQPAAADGRGRRAAMTAAGVIPAVYLAFAALGWFTA